MKKGLLVFGMFTIVFLISLITGDSSHKLLREIEPNSSYDEQLKNIGIPNSIIDIMPHEQKIEITTGNYRFLGMGYESTDSYHEGSFGVIYNTRERLEDENFKLAVMVLRNLDKDKGINTSSYVIYVNYLWSNPSPLVDIREDTITYPNPSHFYQRDGEDLVVERQYVLLSENENLIYEDKTTDLLHKFKYDRDFTLINYDYSVLDKFKGYMGYYRWPIRENGQLDYIYNLDFEIVYSHKPSKLNDSSLNLGSLQLKEKMVSPTYDRVITTNVCLWKEEEINDLYSNRNN